MRKALAGALVALAVGSALVAQEAPPETPDVVVAALASGVGSLAVGGEAEPLPWLEMPRGTLVALSPLVGRLGGELVPGAFGKSDTLRLGGAEFVLADGSAAVTRGTEIVPLSQPVVAAGGDLYVPLDLVQRVWGTLLGVTATWNPTAKRLDASRPVARELAVDISVVHLEDVSTVVLRFPVSPRVRVERHERGWDVLAIGDRFTPAPTRRFDDPFLRWATVSPERISLEVADGVEGESYRLSSPERVVFDLYRPQPTLGAAGGEPPAPRRGLRTVVLDPGHGGAETGAVGPSGTMEKELTLALARTLADRLMSTLGVRVALTRTDDVDLGLDERSAFANQNKADLFLSIHLNSAARGDAHGAETYFLSLQASDERAADAAALENLVGENAARPGSDEFDVQLMLWDLAQSSHLAASQRLAGLIQEELNRELDLPNRGVKQAPFRVLMGAAMPAVLVELGFISTAAEEQKLRDPAYRGELVDTLVRAIARFKTEYDASFETAGGARR